MLVLENPLGIAMYDGDTHEPVSVRTSEVVVQIQKPLEVVV